MQTYILPDAEVSAYLRDLANRLVALGDLFPTTWCPVGQSGDKIAVPLWRLLPKEFQERVKFRKLKYHRSSKTVQLDEVDPGEAFDTCALLLDGPVHSGSTMLAVARWLLAQGVKDIFSYGLVVKRSTVFVPSYFGLMIGEHDRCYFQRTEIPNHRLRRKGPIGILRALEAADAKAAVQYLNTGNSLSTISLADLWYNKQTRENSHIFIYEIAGRVAGFIDFYVSSRKTVVVDAVAMDLEHQGQDVGGLLMRWVENWARNHKLYEVELYAIKDRIGFYTYMKFEPSPRDLLELDGEFFHPMRRRLLYNIDPDSLTI